MMRNTRGHDAEGKLKQSRCGNDVKFDNDVVNILLVGSDRRSDETEGKIRFIYDCHHQYEDKRIKATSLMRDMYVDIPGHGRNKF